MGNNLSFEVIVLVVFSLSLLAVILGITIGFNRLHKKLDRIVALIANTNRHEGQNDQ